MSRWLTILIGTLLAVSPLRAWAQAGVLLVEGQEGPDPSILSLAEMEIDIRIDHLHATVSVTQIFENRTSRSLRGRYELALGRGATVSSFGLWEGEHRRQAVVVERQRGRQIFEELTQRNLDPGLLETSDQGPRQNVYAVRVDPIGPYNRIRVEVGYSQEVELAADEARFVFPMAARDYLEQSVGRLRVHLQIEGPWPFDQVVLRPEEAGFVVEGEGSLAPGALRAELDQREVTLDEDLEVSFRLTPEGDEALRPVLLAHREALGAEGRVDRSAFGGGQRYADERGYFVLRAPVRLPGRGGPAGAQDVMVAIDTSLSMRGGKLERAVGAVEELLGQLGQSDRFGLLTFNDEVQRFEGGLSPWSEERRGGARRFLRSGYLSGGTDLRQALPAALEALAGSEAPRRRVVLITDGQPSLGELESTAIAVAARGANEALGASRARLFILGVGDDANHLLLERLAQESDGLYAHVGEGAEIAPVMRSFFFRLGAAAIEDLRLEAQGVEGVTDLYPAGPSRVFDGSSHVVYGRYSTPTKSARFVLRGRVAGRGLERVFSAALPRRETSRPWIARGWAQRRVEDLLARIDTDGERTEWVQEIIALSREHLLVTPYTSLIAAARTLLRPREITPGDPVLRVRTDPSDRAVTALFPFGLVKPLRPIEPGRFETRFLAPLHLVEGRHEVDLVITGHDGRRRLVRDHFVIDSTAPTPQIDPFEGQVRAGESLALRVRSDRDTRRLLAYLRSGEGGPESPPAVLRWSARELSCLGELPLDPSLPTGTYQVVVIAEDHAHNVGSASRPLEVLAR